MTDPLLTIEEVADLVRAKPETVRRAIRQGKLLATKPASRLLVAPGAVDDWIQGSTVRASRLEERPAVALPTARKSLSRSGAVSSVRERMRQNQQRDGS